MSDGDDMVMLKKALCLRWLGRYDEAIAILKELDESPEALRELGLTYGMLGRYLEAIRCFKRAVEMGDEESRLYFEGYRKRMLEIISLPEISREITLMKAHAYAALGDRTKAMEILNQCLYTDCVHDPKFWFLMALLYLEDNRKVEAFTCYQTAKHIGLEKSYYSPELNDLENVVSKIKEVRFYEMLGLVPPKVTYLVPTYNRREYLKECIRSLLNQDFKEKYEIIVVIDGSNDGTFDMLRERFGPYIISVETEDSIKKILIPTGVIRVVNKPHSGVVFSRNLGLFKFLQSDSHYLSFQDDDDIALPWKTKVLYEHLEQHQDIGMVHAQAEFIDKDGNRIGIIGGRDGNSDELESNNFIHGATVMLRREVVEEVGLFDPRCVYGEDWNYWIRVSKLFKIKFLPNLVAQYRIHPNRMSEKLNFQNII